MTNMREAEKQAFEDAWNACETIPEGLHVLGMALRRASGNPVMLRFREDAGAVAFDTYFEELHPLSDADIDYVLGKMAWQAAQVKAQIPNISLKRYKEARDAVAADPKLQRYVNRVNRVSQDAWWGAKYMYGLPDNTLLGVEFVESVRRLGLPNRDLQLNTICMLVLACKPAFIKSGQLRTSSGDYTMDNYNSAYIKTFGHRMIDLLHTRVPTGAVT